MSGLFPADAAGTAATWVGALATIGAWSYLVGARRVFELLQLLLAGLVTGYLVLIAVNEVLVPQLVVPLATRPADSWPLSLALLGVAAVIGARWLPPRVAGVPIGIIVGGTAAFALGGAVIGTLLPQLVAAFPDTSAGPLDVLSSLAALFITVCVLLGFLHGTAPGPRLARAASVGRWLMLGGIGAWLGFLLTSRLALLVDRVEFLLGDWLGLLR